MKKIILFLTIMALLGMAATAWAADLKTAITPPEALRLLEEGNARFVQEKFDLTRKAATRRQEVAKGQTPFAVIVGCSDSRVPPEVIFDQGLGDLFVVRLAGNLVDPMALGSIEYAVDHLGTPLIVVLAHTHCGAVSAALEAVEKKTKVHGNLTGLVTAIRPAVLKAKGKGEERLTRAIRNNAQNVNDRLEADPVLKKAVKAGKLVIVKGIYDLESGKVTFWTKED